MIQHDAFVVEPWAIHETALDLERLAQTESVFALANGHVGLRANLDEGEPFGLPGTYLAGFYETRPLPYAEAGYGDPEDGQTVVNVTNGKIIRLLVEDEPFDLRYGELHKHERVLDLRAGVLRRTVEWVSPTGRSVRISSTRMVSFRQRAIAAILYEVEPLDDAVQVVVQSELVANETVPMVEQDPRAAAALTSPLASDLFSDHDLYATLVHTTRSSGLTVGAAMDHRIDGPADTETRDDEQPRSRSAYDHRDAGAGRASAPDEVRRLRLVAARGPFRQSATKSPRPWRAPFTPVGTGCLRSSAPISTISGRLPTSRSTATRSFSRRSASRSFIRSRRERAASGGRFRPRD